MDRVHINKRPDVLGDQNPDSEGFARLLSGHVTTTKPRGGTFRSGVVEMLDKKR